MFDVQPWETAIALMNTVQSLAKMTFWMRVQMSLGPGYVLSLVHLHMSSHGINHFLLGRRQCTLPLTLAAKVKHGLLVFTDLFRL